MLGKKTAKQNIIVHPLHVITRQSTDILAIEDRDVALTVQFIRQHSKMMIQVEDVVDAVAVSRRSLERRFRRVLGHSIYEEIRCNRIDKVVEMLVETNKSISQIALALGYSSLDHLSRSFRREKGMSPLAYRREYGRK